MNTKSRKKHKCADNNEPKASNAGAEVFVLSPNMLEKLGIKLDSIVSTGNYPTDVKLTPDVVDKSLLSNYNDVEEYFETTSAINKKNESSILETASLMKESVFLSPTFVPTVANVISGEVEIASPFKLSQGCKAKAENHYDSLPTLIGPKHTDTSTNVKTVPEIEIKHVNNLLTNDKMKYVTTENNHVPVEPLKEPLKDNDQTEVIDKMEISKNSSLESSDEDTDTTEVSKNSYFNSEIQNQQINTRKKKINVINEEVIDVSKLYRRQSINPNVNNNILTPISVNMVLPTASIKNDPLDSSKVEIIDGSQEEVGLLHDIGKEESDFKKSEQFCDFVLNGDIQEVNLLCPNHEENMVNHSINKTNLEDTINEIEDSNNGLDNSKTIEYFHNNIDSKNELDYATLGDFIDESNEEDVKVDDPYNTANMNDATFISEMDIVNDSQICSNIHEMSNIDNVLNKSINHSESENESKFEFCPDSSDKLYDSSSQSTLHRSIDKISVEMISEKSKDSNIKINFIDRNELCMNNENICATSQMSSEKNKDITRVSSCKNNDKEMKKSKTGLRKSKLCIQGVEKPGGDTEDNKISSAATNVYETIRMNKPNDTTYVKDQRKLINELPESSHSGDEIEKINMNNVLKTYERTKKITETNIPIVNNYVKQASNLYEANENDNHNINLDIVCNTDDFCLCDDFGQLRYYDYDISYEHIHFWKHKGVTSDCHVIFSIYNTDTMHDYDEVDRAAEGINESPDECNSKICWNELNNPDEENQDLIQLPELPASVLCKTECEISKTVNSSDIEQFNMVDTCETAGIGAENNLNVNKRSDSDDNLATIKTEKYRKRGKEQNLNITKTTKESVKKRKSSMGVSREECPTSIGEPHSKKDVKCGVCGQVLTSMEWEEHSSKEHGHLAWKAGQTFDFENNDLLTKIKEKLEADGVLTCGFCNIEIKRFKRYISHVQECIKIWCSSAEKRARKTVVANESRDDLGAKGTVICGVCKKDVRHSDWIVHICQKHNYLAWISGETALDLNDVDSVEKHLYDIIKLHGSIICSQCGFDRKYGLKSIKTYISHINTCNKLENTSIKEEYTAVEKPVDSKIEPVSSTPIQSETVKCGVCNQDVNDETWVDHIGKEHNYMAWKDGEQSLDLDDEEEVWQHLNVMTKKYDGLICSKCGLKRKYVKKYLSHIKQCDGTPATNESSLSISLNESRPSNVQNTSQTDDKPVIKTVKCGVCFKKIKFRLWFEHIKKKHNYIAWKDGETPVTEDMVDDNLNNIMNEHGRLQCPNCGLDHKLGVNTVKEYLTHIETCRDDENSENEDTAKTNEDNSVKCGVCGKLVNRKKWIEHIETEHNYLAWKDGETPLNLGDNDSIRLYLFTLVNKVKAFTCSKCGDKKKYPKSFITHLENCGSSANNVDNKEAFSGAAGTCQCAVCAEIVETKSWKDHAMNEHYNIAWKVGDPPIDLKSTYGTEKYLKEYKLKKGKMVCKTCGIGRVSTAGFYAHIIACGKTEEELEEFRNLCEICNNKYLCIYKNQHLAFHREQEYAKERKLKAVETKEMEPNDVPPGRRMAAVKATNVIEKLSSTNEFKHTCAACGFDTDCERKWARHKCAGTMENFENQPSSDESEESENSKDFDLSEEEEIQDSLRKKKNKESIVQAKVPNVPFKYNEVNSYVQQNNEDYYMVHCTDETLFPLWHSGEYKVLQDQEMQEYLPSMEKSCQIKLNNEWNTFERYEAKKFTNGYGVFVGACIQCVSWIPPRLDESDEHGNYLAVSCHRGNDSPRYNYDEVGAHPGLIQIWNMGHFSKEVPAFVMGLAHDYGTIWAMDWCPSGARDLITEPEERKWARLGLLAVACSNGIVYILSVPYPGKVTESGGYMNLKAVAELRLSMSSHRTIYQATAINWSKQKGHAFMSVGYADGTTALYDLNNTSPLLHCKENGISVFYPYHDEREHNVCITDVDSLPAAGAGAGPACSASLGGVAASLRAGAGAGARLHAHAAATACRFAPGWPSVMLAVDDAIASQALNELDWYGCGRRLGPVRACCGCMRCGRVMLYAPPLLRTLRALPPYADLRKQNLVGIRAVPLTKQRVRPNDELSMKVEPLTYDDVILQYGVEVFVVDANDKNNSINTVKEQWTERFPLPDVTSMAFCPSAKHHEKVAVGVHAGLVLLFNI